MSQWNLGDGQPQGYPRDGGVRTFVADGATARRLTKALFNYQIRQPRLLAIMALFLVAVTIFGIAQDVVVGPAVVAGVYLITTLVLIRVKFARALRLLFAPGATFHVECRPVDMMIIGPTSRTEIQYSAFKSIWSGADAVILQYTGSKAMNVFPAELFASADIQRIQSLLRKT